MNYESNNKLELQTNPILFAVSSGCNGECIREPLSKNGIMQTLLECFLIGLRRI